MKKFQEKPISLIVRHEGKKYEVNPEAIQFFRSIQGKIALISVAGVYRTGKSYLLNTIILKQKNGFAVGPTTNPKTKGIWVWGKPLIYKNQQDEIINVCVLDSEGLGSIQEDINHDLRLFSITLLLSSMFIYNTIGAVDQNAIDSLGLVLKLCEHLKAENYNDFPDFYWVLRDFSLALVGKDNKPLSPNKYLENSLSPQPGDSQMRNRIRQSIRSSFTNRSCFTFVRPLTNQFQLQKLDTLEIDQLRPQFTEQVLQFRKLINSNIKTKKIKGKQINSDLLIELINVYVDQINAKEMPQIETGWKYVCTRQCQHVLTCVEKEADDAFNHLIDNLPTTKKELEQKKEAIYESLKKTFQSKTLNNEQASNFVGQINKILERRVARVQEEMRSKNSQQTKGFIKKQFENIERKLKSGQYKSMGELVKQFQLFYEYYRKKCPYKDQIQTGLQFLMKKLSDSSLHMFKIFKTKKDQQTQKLRQQIQKATLQLTLREQKNKQEKTIASDKSAKLQSRIQQLLKQNRVLTDNLSQLEINLEKISNQHDETTNSANEQAEYQLLSLRKKLMEAQDELKELDCKKMLEVNNFKNSIILKDNQINHLKEEINSMTTKLANITQELGVQRDERQVKYQQLFDGVQKLKEENENLRKNHQERMKSKDMQIMKLQNALQSKSNEMTKFILDTERQIKQLMENYSSQKIQLQEDHSDEIKNVKELMQSESEEKAMKMRKIESDIAQRELQLRMKTLQIDKESAILNQKLEFIRRQCSEKEQRIVKLQEQNACYMNIFEEKDGQISNLTSVYDQLRHIHESTTSQMSAKIEQQSQLIQERSKIISGLQEIEQRLNLDIRQKSREIKIIGDKLKQVSKTYQEKIKQLTERLNYQIQQSEKSKEALEMQIEVLKNENSKNIEDQKRNAELSLVQLKNYYEMERERLQKKNLEDRKKHQYTQNSATSELENKHRKIQRGLQQDLQQYKLKIQTLEEQLSRVQNDCQLRVLGAEQDKDNQKRTFFNRYQILERKYEQLQNQYENYQKYNEEQRINFVKKIQGLNFEVSRKEKELLQLTSKRQSLETILAKRQAQIDSVKKMMNQQIEASLKKVSDIQLKYQKLNEEYMQLKIESEKEIALSNQRNEFLNAKLQDLTKEKEITSSRNIDKLDKQKITDLKDQHQKSKTQIMSLQSKLQSQRKAQKEQQYVYQNKIKILEKENDFLNQKQALNLSKITDLQAKIQQKTQIFLKDLQQTRNKNTIEREILHKQCEELRQRLSNFEDQKNSQSWNLQKDIALLNQRMKYAQYQRDQTKRQLQESDKKLQITIGQLKKFSEKSNQDSEVKRTQTDKKYSNQIQKMKQEFRSRADEYEQNIRKQKDEIRQLKDRILQLNQKIQVAQKAKNSEKLLQEENQNLKRQKEILMSTYRTDRTKQNEEWKKKLNQCEKKSKEFQKKNMQNIFLIEKQNSKWAMERQNLLERIKGLEDSIEWQKNKSQLNKSKLEQKKSQSSSMFTSDYRGYSTTWKS